MHGSSFPHLAQPPTASGNPRGAWPSSSGLLLLAARNQSPLGRSGGRCRRLQAADPEQVVGGADEQGGMLRPCETSEAGLAQAAHTLEPAEALFHPFAKPLAQGVADGPRGAAIEPGSLPPLYLRQSGGACAADASGARSRSRESPCPPRVYGGECPGWPADATGPGPSPARPSRSADPHTGRAGSPSRHGRNSRAGPLCPGPSGPTELPGPSCADAWRWCAAPHDSPREDDRDRPAAPPPGRPGA